MPLESWELWAEHRRDTIESLYAQSRGLEYSTRYRTLRLQDGTRDNTQFRMPVFRPSYVEKTLCQDTEYGAILVTIGTGVEAIVRAGPAELMTVPRCFTANANPWAQRPGKTWLQRRESLHSISHYPSGIINYHQARGALPGMNYPKPAWHWNMSYEEKETIGMLAAHRQREIERAQEAAQRTGKPAREIPPLTISHPSYSLEYTEQAPYSFTGVLDRNDTGRTTMPVALQGREKYVIQGVTRPKLTCLGLGFSFLPGTLYGAHAAEASSGAGTLEGVSIGFMPIGQLDQPSPIICPTCTKPIPLPFQTETSGSYTDVLMAMTLLEENMAGTGEQLAGIPMVMLDGLYASGCYLAPTHASGIAGTAICVLELLLAVECECYLGFLAHRLNVWRNRFRIATGSLGDHETQRRLMLEIENWLIHCLDESLSLPEAHTHRTGVRPIEWSMAAALQPSNLEKLLLVVFFLYGFEGLEIPEEDLRVENDCRPLLHFICGPSNYTATDQIPTYVLAPDPLRGKTMNTMWTKTDLNDADPTPSSLHGLMTLPMRSNKMATDNRLLVANIYGEANATFDAYFISWVPNRKPRLCELLSQEFPVGVEWCAYRIDNSAGNACDRYKKRRNTYRQTIMVPAYVVTTLLEYTDEPQRKRNREPDVEDEDLDVEV